MSADAQSKLTETYVCGSSRWRKPPRIHTKPSTVYAVDDDGNVRRDSGGGYERFRSAEHDPTKAGDRKTDVYVAHHRLAAVVWCYPDEWTVGEILDDLAGSDVHHTTGVEWANFGDSPNFPEAGLEVLDHGSHTAITNTQRRAYAEDDKRRATDEVSDDGDVCGRCGDADATLCASDDWKGYRCVECSQIDSDGGEIEVLQ